MWSDSIPVMQYWLNHYHVLVYFYFLEIERKEVIPISNEPEPGTVQVYDDHQLFKLTTTINWPMRSFVNSIRNLTGEDLVLTAHTRSQNNNEAGVKNSIFFLSKLSTKNPTKPSITELTSEVCKQS